MDPPDNRFELVTRRVVCAGLLSFAATVAAAGRAAEGWVLASESSLPPVRFRNALGRLMTLADFEGRPVLVNLWATWCAPCLIELPALDRLQRARRGLCVLAISQDRDGLAAATETYRRARITTLKVFVDAEGGLADAFRIAALPFSALINPTGQIVARRRGRVNWDAAAERDALDRLVGLDGASD